MTRASSPSASCRSTTPNAPNEPSTKGSTPAAAPSGFQPHRPATSRRAIIDFDAVWARFQDANVPFMLHVVAGETPMPDAYRNNGRGAIKDFLGGEGEVLDSKGFMM